MIKGIEESLIENALNLIETMLIALIKELALKRKRKLALMIIFLAKQKICNALNTKGFEGELVYEIVEKIMD